MNYLRHLTTFALCLIVLSGMAATASAQPEAQETGAGAQPFAATSSEAYIGEQPYPTLKAAFDAINAGDLTGNVNLYVVKNTKETATATLNASGSGSASYSSVLIQPTGGSFSIEGSIAGPLIDLNGADNVTMDGLNAGGNSLTLINSSKDATAATIRFINDATGNVLQNCTIEGSTTGSARGVVFFGDTSGTTGNDNNSLSNNDIGPAGANLPRYAIYAAGAASKENNSVSITGNLVHDFFGAATDTAGIYVGAGNTAWTISDNKIYQTAAREFTGNSGSWVTYYGININNTAGTNFQVSGNTLGYGAADGTGATTITGSSYGLNNQFRAIHLNVGAAIASSVQGNTIAGISQTTSRNATDQPYNAGFIAILVRSGLVTIGNFTGNTIGSMTENSITINATDRDNLNFIPPEMGIYVAGSSNATISNNSIGGITVSNADGGTTVGLTGIRVSSSATATISHNTIGGPGADSLKVQPDYGHIIGIQLGTSSGTVSQNTIRNLTHTGAALSGAGSVMGIYVVYPAVATVSQNVIHNLAHTGTGSVVGIYDSASSAVGQIISGNTIHSLSNTHATATVSVTGIRYNGPATGTNLVVRNFVHSLSLATTSVDFNTSINGIRIDGGAATYANNMIRLGLDAGGGSIGGNHRISGIWEANTGGPNAYNFNSVYIGGSQSACASGCNNTYAFKNEYASNLRVLNNNIFVNLRTGAGSHMTVHYRCTLPNPTTLNSDYNLYLAGSETAILHFNGSDYKNYTLADWQTASGQDGHSLAPGSIDHVNFVNPTGDAGAVDLHVQSKTAIEGRGADVGVAVDFDGEVRSNLTPTDIGADAGNYVLYDVTPPVIDLSGADLPTLVDSALSNVSITDDGIGVDTNPGTRPRVYYKRTTDDNIVNDNTCHTAGWKFVEATGTDGSPFSFTLDYSLLSGCGASLDAETVIQFFVMAQDKAVPPNVGIAPATFTSPPSTVDLPAGPAPIEGTLGSSPTPYTWLGAVSSDWNTAANWDSALVPGSSDAAVIPPSTPFSAIVSLPGQTVEVAYLTVKGNAFLTVSTGSALNVNHRLSLYGEINGGGTAAIANMDWYAGWLRNVAVNLAGTLNVKTGSGKYAVYGTTLTVAAGAQVIQEPTAGNVSVYGAANPARIENLGTWDLQGNGGFDLHAMAPSDTRGTVHNAAGALFKKTGGTGQSRMQVTFDNDGVLELHAGELTLEGRDSTAVSSDGRFLIKTGATLVLTHGAGPNGYYVGPTGEIADFSDEHAGNVRFELGNNTVDGAYNISGTTIARSDVPSSHTLNKIVSLGKVSLPAASQANLTLNGAAATFDQNYDVENLSDATLTVNFATFNVLASYTQACPDIAGDVGMCTLAGTGSFETWGDARWGGGSIKGTSLDDRFVAHGPLSIQENVYHSLDGRTLVNAQLATVSDGQMRTNSARIVNAGGAVWDMQCDCDIQQPVSTDSVFENDGLLRKLVGSLADESQFNIVFNNRALVDLRQGVFNFRANAGGESPGDFAVAATTLLRLHGNHTISGRVCGNTDGVLDCSAASTGSVEVWDGGATHFSGVYHITGGTTVKGVEDNRSYWDAVPDSLGPLMVMDTADAYFTAGPVTTPYDVTVRDGAVLELSLSTTFTVSGSYRQLGTAFSTYRQGPGTLVLAGAGPHIWSGGYWYAGGKTVVDAAAALTIDTTTQSVNLWGHTLENHGAVTWSGANNLALRSFADGPVTIDNWGGWDIQTDASMTDPSSVGQNTINNWGEFQKSAGSGETVVLAAFNNKTGGTLAVRAGALYIEKELVNDRGGAVIIGLDRRLGVDSFVANNGMIEHTRSATGSDHEFALITDNATPPDAKYHGVLIENPDMGQTTVAVWGNQHCGSAIPTVAGDQFIGADKKTVLATVLRCYEITPTIAQTADIKFYYLAHTPPALDKPDEPNGNGDPHPWHYNQISPAWDREMRDSSRSNNSNNGYRWVEATGVDEYSLFALLDYLAPTAVKLTTLRGRGLPTVPYMLWVGLCGAILLLGASGVFCSRGWLKAMSRRSRFQVGPRNHLGQRRP